MRLIHYLASCNIDDLSPKFSVEYFAMDFIIRQLRFICSVPIYTVTCICDSRLVLVW
jgi:hypothetical protein